MLLHGDIFRKLIRNDSLTELDNWDNLASHPVAGEAGSSQLPTTLSDCAAHCARDPDCLQYSFVDGKCLTSSTIIKGVPRPNVSSGWMPYRIQTFLKYQPSCEGVNYVLQ